VALVPIQITMIARIAYVEDSEELRRIIEEGDFGAWRVFLHPEQRKYAERTYNGPFRLSGGRLLTEAWTWVRLIPLLASRKPA